MKNITIIGTSHVAKESAKRIKKGFEDFKPDVVCVELDFHRLDALLNPKKQKHISFSELVRSVGLKGALFFSFGKFAQKKIGNILRIQPGIDMLTAVKEARKKNKPIFLIDQDISITLKRVSSNLKLSELFSFFFRGIFTKNKHLRFDIRKTPPDKLVEKIIKIFKKELPSLYKVLVEERNRFMVHNIRKLIKATPNLKVLVIVGAGHKKGMESLLSKSL